MAPLKYVMQRTEDPSTIPDGVDTLSLKSPYQHTKVILSHASTDGGIVESSDDAKCRSQEHEFVAQYAI